MKVILFDIDGTLVHDGGAGKKALFLSFKKIFGIRHDFGRMAKIFRENNYEVTDDFRRAHTIFFNACGLTKETEKNSLSIFNYLKAKKNPSTELIVWSCLPKINNIYSVFSQKFWISKFFQGDCPLYYSKDCPSIVLNLH